MNGSLVQDVAYSCRTLWRRPGFSLLAILTVALGIGVNIATFTIVHGVLWKPLPYPEADRLVMFNEASASGVLNCSYQNLEDWRKRSALFDGISLARQFPPATLRLDKTVESIPTGYAHPDLFALLGVRPVLGRLFDATDDTASAEPVAAITHRAWQRHFAGDPAVIGRRVRAHISFQGKTADSFVVGAVLPEDFRYENIDLWLPLNRFWGAIDEMRGNHWFRGIGRLKHGVTIARATAELDSIARDLERQYPATNRNVRPRVASLIDYYTGRVRDPLLVLLGAVGFVMLIACGNVVHLLLTRTLSRRREIAIRIALGAERGRLLQLLLAEGLMIATIGGAAGLLLSYWAVTWTLAFQPRLLPRAQTIAIDQSAILYALAITAATFGILGVTPLWQASRARMMAALQSAGRGGTDRRQRRLGWAMVTAELAMASVLLAGAGLMIQTLRNLSRIDPGYQPENVLAIPLGLPGFQYRNQDQASAAAERLMAEVRTLPGLSSVAYAEPFAVGGNGMLPPVKIPGRDNPVPLPMVPAITVSAEFFETLRIPLRAGRYPARNAILREALVNEIFERRFFPNENAVGKRIDIGGPMEIVGVVGNTHLQGPVSAETPEVYWSNHYWGAPAMLVRTAGSPDAMVAAIREKLRRAEPELRIGTIQTLDAQEGERTSLRRFTRSLLLVFAVLAVILASLGVYGVASYSVAQRTREIGIRMALGASRGSVARMVLESMASAALAGVVLGAAGAAALAKWLSTQLYGVTAKDPVIYAMVIAVIVSVAMVASAVPVMRASRIDPGICLRDE